MQSFLSFPPKDHDDVRLSFRLAIEHGFTNGEEKDGRIRLRGWMVLIILLEDAIGDFGKQGISIPFWFPR